jgi:hypothetical protein
MTVYELIQQLQDCDKPDATASIRVRQPNGWTDVLVEDVYYHSIASNEVVLEGAVEGAIAK